MHVQLSTVEPHDQGAVVGCRHDEHDQDLRGDTLKVWLEPAQANVAPGQAPHAVQMHPTDEHLLPFYVAAGAGGRDALPERLHSSVTHGWLGMDTYAFGAGAQRLHAIVANAEPRANT